MCACTHVLMTQRITNTMCNHRDHRWPKVIYEDFPILVIFLVLVCFWMFPQLIRAFSNVTCVLCVRRKRMKMPLKFLITYFRSYSEVAQSCLTLCELMDCSLPGSSVHGIFQARILEQVAISFFRGSSQLRDQTRVSCAARRLFTFWATREAILDHNKYLIFILDHNKN